MKRIITAVALTALLTACGHNVGTVVHGKFLNVGYDPELNKIGVQYIVGTMATGLQKENSESDLTFTDTATDKDGRKTESTLDWHAKNGDQVTGYRVELEEVKAEKDK